VAILIKATFLVNRIYAADRRRIEALHQVEYANKLASIERLAVGLAHEINNPLAIINEKAGLALDLIETGVESPQGARRLPALLNDIRSAVSRCGVVTRRLLNFARDMEVGRQAVDLGTLVQGMVDFVAVEARRRGIEIRVQIPEKMPVLESDPSLLQQILLNLLNNSFAAMPGGGVLEIRAERQDPDLLAVQVADSGCGIGEEDLPRVFEPFFTTRSHTGGTGLGLSITRGLVLKLGGAISVQSQPGEGARFTVQLPLGKEGNLLPEGRRETEKGKEES
jgi:signal transduction histidine kinase